MERGFLLALSGFQATHKIESIVPRTKMLRTPKKLTKVHLSRTRSHDARIGARPRRVNAVIAFDEFDYNGHARIRAYSVNGLSVSAADSKGGRTWGPPPPLFEKLAASGRRA